MQRFLFDYLRDAKQYHDRLAGQRSEVKCGALAAGFDGRLRRQEVVCGGLNYWA